MQYNTMNEILVYTETIIIIIITNKNNNKESNMKRLLKT